MSTANSTTKHLLLRLLLAAAAVILSHDVLMAMDAHAESVGTAAHHEVVADGCGSVEGNRSPEQMPPDNSPEGAFLITSHRLPLRGTLAQFDHQVLIGTSASKLRAMLQVFLN